MDLWQFNDKCVRLTCIDGAVYEGIVSHNSADYNEHEFGREEEGLEMPGTLFYARDIASVESLEDREEGPWGKFSAPFGRLEEESLFDPDGDPVLACEILDCEEPEHVMRMLRCLGYYSNPEAGREIPGKEQLLEQLRVLVKYSDDPEAVRMASCLIADWTGEKP